MAWLWAHSIESTTAVLVDDEVHHLKHVLRKRPGHQVRIIDGIGNRATGRWSGAAHVEIDNNEKIPCLNIELILALGAKTSNEESLRRAAEMGVTTIWPVLSQHSSDAGAPKVLSPRWESILRSGCTQSGNAWLPQLKPIETWTAICQELGAQTITVCSPQAEKSLQQCMPVNRIAVGPEGGFTPQETQHCQQAHLGPFILRTPVAVAAILGTILSGR